MAVVGKIVLNRKTIVNCNKAWPQFKLNDQSQWPENGILDFKVSDCDNFCNQTSK